MRSMGFTDQQRHAILIMGLLLAVVAGLFAGFTGTSLENSRRAAVTVTAWSDAADVTTPPPTSSVSAAAASIAPVPTEGIWSQVQAARLFHQIAPRVASERELAAITEMPLSFLEEPDMAALFLQLHQEQDLSSQLVPYTSLGLMDQRAVASDTAGATAIYVPAHRQLYISAAQPLDNHRVPTLLAHAYAHALQDQHFGLEATTVCTRTVDEALAARALVAGDAMIVTALYRYGDLSSADWSHLSDLVIQEHRAQYLGDLAGSEAGERLLGFLHREGRLFVQQLFEAGGWDAVNQAHTHVPRSTREILHPSRYLEDGDRPTPVNVPDLGQVLGRTWHLACEETLGEFLIRLYLSQVLPEDTSRRAAAGWAGDTFVVWERDDRARALVWRTLWDTGGDAVRFQHSLADAVVAHDATVRAVGSPDGMTGQWWESDTQTVHVNRAGRYVLLVQAPGVSTAVRIVGAMPEETWPERQDLDREGIAN